MILSSEILALPRSISDAVVAVYLGTTSERVREVREKNPVKGARRGPAAVERPLFNNGDAAAYSDARYGCDRLREGCDRLTRKTLPNRISLAEWAGWAR